MTTTVTVNITAHDAAGDDLAGTITFTPSAPLLDATGNVVVGCTPVVATLSGGTASVDLAATDDAGTSSSDPTYTVVEELTGGGETVRRKFRVELPAASTTVRYEDLVPVTTGQALASYALASTVNALTVDVTSRPRLGVDCAAVGDSNTIGYDPPTSLPTDYRPVEQSWLFHATFGSRGQLRFLSNEAVGGTTSTQIAATVSDAITAGADVVFVMAGTNDLPSWDAAVFATNVEAMVAECRAADVLPVLLTVPPRATLVDEVAEANGWLRDWCRRNRVDLIDTHAALINPATGDIAAAYGYGDGVHLNVDGAKLIGQAVVDWAEQRFSAWSPAVASIHAVPSAGNLLGTACFAGTITSGVPAGWTAVAGSEFSGATAGTLVAPTAADSVGCPFAGNWWQVAKAASSSTSGIYQTISTGFSVGDVIEFSGRVQVDDDWSTAGEWYVDAFLSFTGSGGATLAPVYDVASDADLTFGLRRAVPAGTTAIVCYLRVRRVSGSLTGTVRFGQVAVRNITVDGFEALA
jgi:lysophospholipase L1-like esterase